MNPVNTTATAAAFTITQQEALSASDQSDALSLELFHLAEIVRLAAFAVEAQRTLRGVFDELTYHPKANEYVASRVDACNNWTTFDRSAAENLRYAADRMDGLREKFHLLACEQAVKTSTSGGPPHAG